MSYKDQYQFYHDRQRGSGNGVLYSAYAAKMAMYDLDEEVELKKNARKLISKDDVLNLLYTKRYFDDESPDSIDNMIGFVSLGLLNADDYEKVGWYFRGSKSFYSKYSWFKLLKTLWKYRKELLSDRNYFHENGLDEVGKLAYWIPPQYRYYIKCKSGKSASFFEKLCFVLHILFTSRIKDQGKDTSPKNIAVLMLEDLGSEKLIKRFNKVKQYDEYFEKGHPFRDVVRFRWKKD